MSVETKWTEHLVDGMMRPYLRPLCLQPSSDTPLQRFDMWETGPSVLCIRIRACIVCAVPPREGKPTAHHLRRELMVDQISRALA